MKREKYKNCLNCGKEVPNNRRKYCSTKCGDQYYNRKYNIENRDRLIFNKREYRKKHPEKTKKYSEDNKERTDQYYQDNKESIKKKSKKYYKENKEKKLKYAVEYGRKNRKRISAYHKEWESRDPLHKVNRSIACCMRNSLKRRGISKRRRHWEDLVGYSKKDLKDHLESLFTEGMTWDNYGKNGWHIDHIIAKSFFTFASTDDVEFKYCWSLYNLQPLWEKDNLEKNDKLIPKHLKKQLWIWLQHLSEFCKNRSIDCKEE